MKAFDRGTVKRWFLILGISGGGWAVGGATHAPGATGVNHLSSVPGRPGKTWLTFTLKN